ncbi:hypothetical protein [Roseococcus sp. YIM B11640]|uniref:hypothetical protein n=1 Tax=Roseococcus sp. YIM B11640 TaxID=3133973 RepID=UPI003C7DE182
MSETAVTAIVFDASPATQGANQVAAAGQKIIDTNQAVVTATQRTIDVQANMERALARLTRQIDPAAAAQQKLEAGQRLLERAFQAGRISIEEHARRLEMLDARYSRAASGGVAFSAANDNAATRTRNFGSIIGQAGFQIQDFAVQVGAGQSALVAFGQQGSQLLGIFGPAGAVAGAALAIGVIAAQLLLGKSAADQFTEAMKRQSEGLSNAERDAQRWRDGLADETKRVQELTAYYGALSQARQAQERRLFEQDRQNLSAQQDALRNDALGRLTTDFARTLRDQVETALAEARRNYGANSEEFRIIASDQDLARMRDMAQAIELFAQKGDVSRESLAQLRDILQLLGEGSDLLSQRFSRQAGAIDGLNDRARQIEAAMEQLRARAAALGINMGGAADETDRLGRALAALSRYEAGVGANFGQEIANLQRQIAAARQGAEALRLERGTQERESRLAIEVEKYSKELERLGVTGEEAARRMQEFRNGVQGQLGTIGRLGNELHGLEDGFRRSGRSARDAASDFGELGRQINGLIAFNDADQRGIQAAMRALNNTALDPDRLAKARREAEQLIQSARSEAEKYGEVQERLRVLLDGSAESQELYNRAVAAAEPAQRAAREAAQRSGREIEQANKSTTDNIVRYGAETFADLFDKNKGGWRNMWETFERTARSTLARIAAELVLRPIIQPIVSGLGLGSLGSSGGGFSLGGIFGGGSTATGAAASGGSGVVEQVGNLSSGSTVMRGLEGFNPGNYMNGSAVFNTGWSGLDNVLNTPVFSGANSALQGPTVSGAALGSSGYSIGSLGAGALGIAGGLYGAYSGFERGGVGGYTQAAGGAATAGLSAAALAGATVPVAGWIAAAVLMIAGALLPGQKPSNKGQETAIDLVTAAETYRGLSGERYSAANREQSAAAAGRIAALAGQLGDALGGIKLYTDAAVGVTSGRGDGDPGRLYLRVGNQRNEFENTEEGAKALADQATKFLLDEFRRAASGDMKGILDASGTIEQLQENLTWYKETYQVLTDTAEASSAFADSVRQIEAGWQTQIDKATSLSLATDKLIAKRDEEVAALTKQRDAQVTTIRQTLALRDAMAASQPAWEIITSLSQAAQWQAWSSEVEQLKAQLKDLGLTSAEVAAQVAVLQRAQGAEYWKSFADWGEQLDRSVITDILRATGRAAQADLYEFEAAAKKRVETLRQQLATWGLDAETVQKKVMETQEAIAYQRIELEKRVAEEAAAAQEAAAAEAKAAWEAVLSAGQSIRGWIDQQRGSTSAGVSPTQALAQAQDQFGRDLTLARGGNQEALGRITTTADRLLQAGQAMYASGDAFQALKQFVLASLENLPATKSYDEQILEELKKLGGRVDVEVGIAVVRTISETLNALPDAARAQLVQAQTVVRSIEDRIGRYLTTAELNRLVDGEVVVRSVEQVMGRNLTTPERSSLVESEKILLAIEQKIGRNLTTVERASLVLDDDISRDIFQRFGRNLTTAERAALVQGGDVLRDIEQRIGRQLTAAERASIVAEDEVLRLVEQAMGRNLTAAERAGLVQAADVTRQVEQVIGRNLTAAERASILLPGDVARNIKQAVETTETVQISRSIDDKLSGVMSDVRHNTEVTASYLNRIDVYTNQAQQHLAVMRVNLNQLATWAANDGLVVRSSPWSHANTTAITKFAEGGRVYGGVPGVDSVPALLMPGEGVLRKAAMDRLGWAFDELQRGELPVRPVAVPVSAPPAAANDSALRAEIAQMRGQIAELAGLVSRLVAGQAHQTAVISAVGEEAREQGAETNDLLARQEAHQRRNAA